MTRTDAPKAPSKALRAVLATLFFMLLVPGVAFGLELDIFFAGGDALARVILCCFVLGATFPALIVVAIDRRRWMKITYAAVAAVALLLAFVPWHPRMLFVGRLQSLTPGMTVDDVETVMGRYMKGMGKKWGRPDSEYPVGDARAHATGRMTYRWSDDGAYDSDWGQVEFKDGRVVAVEFLPD